MFNKKKSQGFLNNLTPRAVFTIGAISGLLLVCTIGFFILLGVVLTDRDRKSEIVSNNINSATSGQVINNQAENLKEITAQDHIRGNRNAPIVLVEFSDFQCPYCDYIHPTLKKLVEDYGSQIAWVYKHLPLDSLHPFARKAAEASECAAEQGRFWEYADELYANQSQISLEFLSQVADNIGLNVSQFETCISSSKYASLVADNVKEAGSVGITGTPGIYLNDILIKGVVPYESFKQVIDSILNNL